MELTEWQISLISTAVGASIPLVFVIFREMYQDRKRGRETRDVLLAELTLSQEVLKEALSKGKAIERVEDRVNISDDMPIYDSFPLDTTYYDDVDIETLAKHLKTDQLKVLQKVYRMIYRYNQSFTRIAGGLWINIALTTELLKQMEQTINALEN